MKVLLGCDPEIFVTNKDGMPRSAHGLVPGTKESPYKCAKGAYQVDGMALEFNIDPANDEEEWVGNIKTVMQKLREATPKEYEFLIAPSVTFNGQHLKAQPDEAKELGCMPDFNAYTMRENPRPNAATAMRTASGHIHIGFTEGADPNDEEHIVRCAVLAKHLDLFLGVRSLEWDKDQKRRKLYGAPGAIRIKPYGVEYRVLSNAWLLKEEYVRFVYRQTLACIDDLRTNGKLEGKRGQDPYTYVKYDIEHGRQYYSKAASYVMKGLGKNDASLDNVFKLKIGA